MAAPSDTTWGSKVNDYGRIGIYIDKISSTATQLQYQVQIWFWSKYSVSDTSNTFKYDHLEKSGSATTSRGDRSISTTSDSGGWSTTNQKKIYTTSTYTINRTTSSQNRYIYASLAGVNRVNGTMKVNRTYSIEAKTKYTITYNANGGTGAPAADSAFHGTATTLSSTKPTRSGYTFLGWSTSSTATSATYSAGGSITITANTTLYAVWKQAAYTITYNANGGTGAPAAQTTNIGTATTLSSTKPTRTNYIFKNWNTVKGGTGTAYSPGASFPSSSSNVTLYAQWTPYTHTVAYNANGGSGAPASQTKTAGTTLKLQTGKPTRNGYNFKGWGTSTTDTTVDYNPGSNYTRDQNGGTYTLYAIWSANDIIFAPTYCQAVTFIEGSVKEFNSLGTITYPKLIEKANTREFSANSITFPEFIER